MVKMTYLGNQIHSVVVNNKVLKSAAKLEVNVGPHLEEVRNKGDK